MAGINNRSHVRTKLRARITLKHPDGDALQLHTGDISDGGAYVLAEGHQLPAIGEVVSVQLQGLGGDEQAPVVKMRVVRSDPDGIGLVFVDQE